MDELRTAIASLFRRKGRDELSEKEFVLSASMDLRWFPPRDAQRLLQRGLDENLMTVQAGVLRPTFEVAAVDVPRDFTPTPAILAPSVEPREDLFRRIVDAIVARTGAEPRAVIASINRIQERMDVALEVAALIEGHRVGVDPAPFLESVEARLGIRPVSAPAPSSSRGRQG